MTTELRVRQEDAEQESLTPTLRRTARRAVFWIATGVVVLFVVVLVIAVGRRGLDAGIPLAADNPAPAGAMALAEVLRQQGVDVIETDSLAETEEALDDAAGETTVLLWDIDQLLDHYQHGRLILATDDLVVAAPGFLELEDFAPGIAQAGETGGEFDTDCDLAAASKATNVNATGSAYRIIDSPSSIGCFAADDRFGLVQTERNGATVALLGLTGVLTNGEITKAGNAALALNLLGKNETLVWYIPGVADLSDQLPPSIDELTPPWVTPLAVMLLIVTLGAILWKARRVGPLVVENLPVTVRARETMEGRARLYERSNSRLHALDALRIGTVSRLARSCGLPRTATVAEVVDAVAAMTGRDRAVVANILIDQAPESDVQLVQLSDQLLLLERETKPDAR